MLSLVASLTVVSLLSLGCSEDEAPAPANPGGVGTGGSAGAGTGGSAGAGAAGTTGDAGAAGTTGGAGAAGAPTGALPDLSGCTLATATDGTAGPQTVAIPDGSFKYSPSCLKVKVGTIVTFTGAGSLHPLRPGTKGSAGNPIPSSQAASVEVTFAAEGAFPYFCANHGADGGTTGMVGAVYVTPLGPTATLLARPLVLAASRFPPAARSVARRLRRRCRRERR